MRVSSITGTLVVLGAVAGAVSGAAMMVAAALFYLHTLPSAGLLGSTTVIGAAIGAAGLPLIGWGLLRGLPIRVTILGIGVGSLLGGLAGLLVGAERVNPYVPMSLSRAPFAQCAAGVILGVLASTAGLRMWNHLRPQSRKVDAAAV